MKNTNENIDEIKEKLDYIGLDFDNIPDFLKEYTQIEFRTIRENEQRKYKIYKYIDVRDIQIYITPKNRMDSFIEKYKLAKMAINYIDPKEEEDIPLQAKFLKMIKDIQIEEIEKLEETQKSINKKIPFKVSYEENYLWEIYYSQVYNKFFMLVPAEDSNYASLFYLIKKQIESYKSGKESKIYVPVCYMEYTEKYLKRSEISDIENYLWLFTGDWPNIYEVFDKKEEMTLQIVGNTYVYDNLKSYYKIILKEKEDAVKFYKYIKALFILQSELSHKYKFIPKIDRYGMLDLYFEGKKVTYEKLPEFIENEYKKISEDLQNVINEKFKNEKELEEKKEKVKKQEAEYHKKEKEITLYLECKKTFFGKIKYYFKHKKIQKETNKELENKEKISIEKEKIKLENKRFLTIEDLINLYKIYISKETELKNLNLDIIAINSKLEMLDRKIKNATQYIKEIDKHNKSIFEFWKFTNKDENLALAEGNEIKEEILNKLQKTFEFDTDFEDFGVKIDRLQRKELNKTECDSIYLAQTNLLECLNIIKPYVGKDKKISPKDIAIIKLKLEEIQKEAEKNKELFKDEDFDIFGGLSEDNRQIKHLNGKKHREIERNRFEILQINKNTTTEEYIDSLKNAVENILSAIEKIKSIENMPIYKCTKEMLDVQNFEVFNINIENSIDDNNENEYLYKINLKENQNALYLSNIMYFDNKNNTLPEGMDISDKVLIDLKQYELELISKDTIKINQEEGLYNKVRTLNVYEYKLK